VRTISEAIPVIGKILRDGEKGRAGEAGVLTEGEEWYVEKLRQEKERRWLSME
jgi:hypothetical protein